MNIFSIYIYACPLNIIVISTAQTDLGLRSRIFSLKINKLPSAYISEITQITKFYLPKGFQS